MKTMTKTGISAYGLKLIALAFMILDHIHNYLNIGPRWITILTRFVAPLFVFLLVEGFMQTRNRKKYALRLWAFALLVMIVNVAINYFAGNVDPVTGTMTYYSLMQGNNIFQTLAVFMLILMLLEYIKTAGKWQRLLAGLAILVLSFYSIAFTEGGFYLLPILLICYYGYGNKIAVCGGIIIWSLLLLMKALYSYISSNTGLSLLDTLSFDAQWAMIFTVIPIMFYNGKRGNNTPLAKWLFYIVYPVHLWLLMLIRYMINN